MSRVNLPMNKNTKRRLRAYRKQCKKNGWPKFVYKAKAQPFPQPPR